MKNDCERNAAKRLLLEVNFLEDWETRPDGKVQRFSWVTDLPIDDAHVMALMRIDTAHETVRGACAPCIRARQNTALPDPLTHPVMRTSGNRC